MYAGVVPSAGFQTMVPPSAETATWPWPVLMVLGTEANCVQMEPPSVEYWPAGLLDPFSPTKAIRPPFASCATEEPVL